MAKRILIIDDSVVMRQMIRDILESYGYEVIGEADDGDVGLEMYKRLKPDMVTLDIVMVNMNGLETLRRIKEHDKGSKVIIISALDQREALLEAIRLGAADFLVKPFEEDRVITAVKKVLEK